MIGFLKGYVVHKREDSILMEVNHIGYNVFVSGKTLEQLPSKRHEVTLYTYLQVREDAMSLYGFLRTEELELFKLLISVSGIGPKVALGFFQIFTANDLKFAILAGDAKAIAKSPGIGPKTAQRVIIELKDKVSLEEAFEERSNETAAVDTSSGAAADAIEALAALGYSSTEAYKAVRAIEGAETMSSDQILKVALKSFL